MQQTHLSVGLSRKVAQGDTVVIIGMHLIGLGTLACLKKSGIAPKVIVADISEKRLSIAKDFGADMCINTLKDDLVQVIMQETRGDGVDIVFQADPRPISHQQAMSIVRRLGKVWIAEQYDPFAYSPRLYGGRGDEKDANATWVGPDAAVPEDLVMYHPNLFFMKCAWGTLGPRMDRWLEVLELVKEKRLTSEKLVTHVYPLDKVVEAIEMAQNPFDSLEVHVKI